MAVSDEIYDDEYYLNLPVASDRIKTLTELLDFRPDDVVCEIGCAAGHFLAEIAPQISSGIGIDTARAAIESAQRMLEREHLGNIIFEQVSAQEFASREQNLASYDHVLLLDVTEHTEDPVLVEVLTAAKRLLKPDGQLVIHTPNLSYWLEQLKDKGVIPQLEGHVAVRNESQYAALLAEAGFGESHVKGLPHYRQPLRLVDILLMRVPVAGRLFRSRLFIVVPNAGLRQGDPP